MKRPSKRAGSVKKGKTPASGRAASNAPKTTGSKVPTKGLSRRDLLARAGYGAVGALVFAGAGLWGVRHVQAITAEHDLDRLGQGTPSIVQVHDPQCPVCNALQTQTRKALGRVDADILYLVANIRTQEGSAFAARYGEPHVTLLLFDADGTLRDTLRGPHEAEQLEPAFDRLVRGG